MWAPEHTGKGGEVERGLDANKKGLAAKRGRRRSASQGPFAAAAAAATKRDRGNERCERTGIRFFVFQEKMPKCFLDPTTTRVPPKVFFNFPALDLECGRVRGEGTRDAMAEARGRGSDLSLSLPSI